MKKRNIALILSAVLIITGLLGACGAKKGQESGKSTTNENGEKQFSIAMVTDTGGVDDKSFNQSAWKGIQDFGKAQNLERGDGGYDYLQSNDPSDYTTNLNNLVRRDFDLVYGVGYLLEEALGEIAEQRTEANFAIIDGEVKAPNVVSVLFKDQEAGFLAGVTAALMTKTNKVGFVGGMEIPVIKRFEAGFVAGVEAANPDVEVERRYAGEFEKAELGKATANLMYSSNVDIIFHAAGGTGNGVFAEAKERKKANPNADIWVIGVDSDQYDEGQVGEHNITLTSVLKRIDEAVVDIAELAQKDEFPGGETLVLGVAENRIELADSHGAIPQEVLDEIDQYRAKIANGEIVVPDSVK